MSTIHLISPRRLELRPLNGGVAVQSLTAYSSTNTLGLSFTSGHERYVCYPAEEPGGCMGRRRYGNLQCNMSVGLLMHLSDACVPPTASYGCEVWGLRELPAGEYRKGRDAFGTSHLRVLKELAIVPTSVSTDMLLQELRQRPLSQAWWRRIVNFWNALVDLPIASIYKQVALDSCRDAIDSCRDAVTCKVKNWAGGVFSGVTEDCVCTSCWFCSATPTTHCHRAPVARCSCTSSCAGPRHLPQNMPVS